MAVSTKHMRAWQSKAMRWLVFALAPLMLLGAINRVPGQEWQEVFRQTGFGDGDDVGKRPSISGDTLAVGASKDDDMAADAGAVYIYVRDDNGTPQDLTDDIWLQQAKLYASDADEGDRFGQHVELEGDRLAVGSAQDDDNGADSGSAYVFERVGTTWIETAKITPTDGQGGDLFGRILEIEGDTLVVSAFKSNSVAGKVYVYEFDGSQWNYQQTLVAAGIVAGDQYGRDVAIADGLIAIGTPRQMSATIPGSVYLYAYDDVSDLWVETQELTASDGLALDDFGWRVEIDQDVLAVGAIWDDAKTGSGYVYVRDDNGTPTLLDDVWTERSKLMASDGIAGDQLGRGVAVYNGTVLIAAWDGETGYAPKGGSIYQFDRDDNGTPADPSDDSWTETAEFSTDDLDAREFAHPSVNATGTLVVGDNGHLYTNGNPGSGAFHVFELAPEATERLVVVDTSKDDFFEYDMDVNLLDNYNLGSGNNAPRGVATDSVGYRWVIDNDDYVYVYDPTGTKIGGWKAMGLSRPEGITTDGTNLWIVDRGYDRVYYFANGAGRTSGSAGATSNFKLRSGNTNPRGIHTDGSTMWVVNIAGSKDRIYVYDMTGASQGYWQLDSTNYNPRGVTVDAEGNLLTVDVSTDSVYVYAGAATRTSGSQNADSSAPLDSNNYNPQGLAIAP